ncbi:uncharacterized protein LOC112456130 [Temnothorax curvispinosus]|uniref:Uncharacterized protein LOC112456130 n=1 Tax=Temnothorax curvispinosus TaxID=300111 RepID=A0A6J1PWF3_9HYME|nr:uncharacterized protein LOC112456130 [Temnothorax curvispinosus]
MRAFEKSNLTVQSMSNKVEIFKVNGDKMYKCQKCGEMSKRRFNVERHYRRFHEKIKPQKTCCDKIFYTKSDFYNHRHKIHEEKKKYTKEYKSIQNQRTSKFQCPAVPKVEQPNTKEILVEIQNKTDISRSPIEKLNAPKKGFLSRWQKDSYKCKNRRSATKRPSRRRVPTHPLSVTKENIKIYNVTEESKEGIDRALYSIKF